jgi:hypothetical protein
MTTTYHQVSWGMKDSPISELLGKTFTSVRGEVGGEQIEFVCDDGSIYVMHHSQDCCERVSIESIVGDLADLVGSPILHAEESTNDKEDPPGYKPEYEGAYRESFTWTFYKLATVKGWVDIRWLGESNGYYSESVGLTRVAGPNGEKVNAETDGVETPFSDFIRNATPERKAEVYGAVMDKVAEQQRAVIDAADGVKEGGDAKP